VCAKIFWGPTSLTPLENGAGEFSGQKTCQHFPIKTGSRVVQLSKSSDFRAPAGQFTCVHPTRVPLGEGLRFRLACNRGVVLLKIPRASVITRTRSQVGLLVYSDLCATAGRFSSVHPSHVSLVGGGYLRNYPPLGPCRNWRFPVSEVPLRLFTVPFDSGI
jgi:hypothetical protein